MNQKIDKKNIAFILVATLLAIICIGVIAAGAILMAMNAKQFNMYNTLWSTWVQYSGNDSLGFAQYVKDYNALAAANKDWVQADFTLFVTGISLLIIGLGSTIGLVVFVLKRKKKASNGM